MVTEPRAGQMMCATCSALLAQGVTTYRLPNSSGTTVAIHEFSHVLKTDHDPVPIPVDLETARPICDFCTSPAIRWTHYSKPVRLPRPTPYNDVYDDDGRWACCDICHNLILAEAWSLLIERAMAIHRSMLDSTLMLGDLRIGVTFMHRVFINHRTGKFDEETDYG